MGYEMGHYILNHEYKGLAMFGVVVVIGFAFLSWGINFGLARWGENWGIRGMTDMALLPLAIIWLSVYFFLLTPVTNTITRTMEYEADLYGLNAARQPDGEANVDLMLGEYRKLQGRLRNSSSLIIPAGAPGSPLPCAGRPSTRSRHPRKSWSLHAALFAVATAGPRRCPHARTSAQHSQGWAE
jgi:Zn-dependent protease with chaperone function